MPPAAAAGFRSPGVSAQGLEPKVTARSEAGSGLPGPRRTVEQDVRREGKLSSRNWVPGGSSWQGEPRRPYGFNLWRAERPAIFHFHLCFLLPNSWNFLNLVS